MSPKKTPKRKLSKARNSGKLSVQLFRPLKRVSFSPEIMNDSEDSDEAEIPLSPMRKTDAPTPTVSSGGKRKLPVTPHPSSKQAKRRKNVANSPEKTAETKVKKERPRRKMKRPSYTLFPSSTGSLKARPNSTLTAQLSYLLETLPSKITALKKETNICHSVRIQELEKLEDNLLKRMELVSNLKVNAREDDTMDKKYEVIEEMEDKVLEVQNLRTSKQQKLEEERPRLRANHDKRFVCCTFCVKIGNI